MSPAHDDLSQFHRPVMISEVLEHLFGHAPAAPRRLVVDGTVGSGGHAEAVLEADDASEVLGLDRDPEMLAVARRRLAAYGKRVRLVHASYADLERALEEAGEGAPWGVLLDLGASSLQFDDPARGFSFRETSPDVDMRFDRTSDGPTALDLVNRLPERELADTLHTFGDEPRARAVARALTQARPVKDGDALLRIVRRTALRMRRRDTATRTFQALRIAVNQEFEHLERGLDAALGAVAPGGRVVVLSFHSGEDRRVKVAMRQAAKAGLGTIRTPKPLRPSDGEVRENPRARPARFRAFERQREDDARKT